jgi:hypothetical protein
LYLSRLGGALAALGRGILRAAPWLMKGLSVAGTAAMFLVGGSILVHGVPALHHWIEPWTGGAAGWLVSMLFDAAVGIVAGALVLGVVVAVSRVRGRKQDAAA